MIIQKSPPCGWAASEYCRRLHEKKHPAGIPLHPIKRGGLCPERMGRKDEISIRCCCFAIAEIPAEDYPVKVWEDAVSYITGTEVDFKTAEEAKQRLLEYF